MTEVERLAEFAVGARYEDLSTEARKELKIRILDALGCAIAATDATPIHLVRAHLAEFHAGGPCTLIGSWHSAPDRATFYNGALVRYLDFNDSYLAKGETCHPSDNLAPVLAAAEASGRTGRDLMTALAVAYQVQCRLSDEAPVRAAGFDHTTQGAYAVAAGVSNVLELDPTAAANAIAICGTAFNALRVTRTGRLSHWKGLAYANAAAGCVRIAFLARHGITGPLEVFEGNKGFMESIAGHFVLDWRKEDLERVNRTVLKRHNAEIHSQTAIDAALELRQTHRFSPLDIDRIDVDTFDVAHNIIGGGEEGDKTLVTTKEEADHSLPYLIAVALLDGQVWPPQFAAGRISNNDVQQLLRRVTVRTDPKFSQRFPSAMPCRVSIRLNNGRSVSMEADSYPCLGSPPFSWEDIAQKFRKLVAPHATPETSREIVEAVKALDGIRVSDLTHLLSVVNQPTVAG
jgi:2-methylcitrate dehydratase